MTGPNKRNLTDELQSVLLAHSFDAPEPAASIENILSRTTGSVSEGAAARRARRAWFSARNTMILGASAAAVVVAAVSVPMLLDNSASTRPSTAARDSSQDQAYTADGQSGGALGSGSGAGRTPLTNGKSLAGPPTASGSQLPSVPKPDQTVAAMPCVAGDVKVDLGQLDAVPPAVALLRFTNVSGAECTVGGYPNVAVRTSSPSPSAQYSVAQSVPEANRPPARLVSVPPGASATATLDGSGPATCNVTSLVVSLPNGDYLATLPFGSKYCGFTVHPLVR